MKCTTVCASVAVALCAGLSGSAASAGINSAEFDQLSWHGDSQDQLLSPWGRVTFDFDRQPELRFLNLSILKPGDAEPTWVVRNLGVAGYAGDKTDRISTMLDLGIPAPGELVSRFDYAITLGTALDAAPAINVFDVPVNQVDFRIGGVPGRDPGDPGPPPESTGGPNGKVIIDVTLPGRDAFENQVQDIDDCAVAALSNSLKYLESTGKGDLEGLTDMGFWEKKFGRDSNYKTPGDWMIKKKEYFDANPELGITTTFIDGGLTKENLEKVAEAVKQGQDVELCVDGHVVVVAGVRVYENDALEIDVYDDNQWDEGTAVADPMRTVYTTLGGQFEGKDVVVFVVEIPSPSTLVVFLATMAIPWNGRRR